MRKIAPEVPDSRWQEFQLARGKSGSTERVLGNAQAPRGDEQDIKLNRSSRNCGRGFKGIATPLAGPFRKEVKLAVSGFCVEQSFFWL